MTPETAAGREFAAAWRHVTVPWIEERVRAIEAEAVTAYRADLARIAAVLIANARGAALIHLQRGGYCIDCGQRLRDGHGDDCAVARYMNDAALLPTQASDSKEKPT